MRSGADSGRFGPWDSGAGHSRYLRSERSSPDHLNLHSSDWAKLKANFQTNDYYPSDLTWNGETVRNVGIRSRGRGSRSGVKPGLRVDFDRYTTGQTFLAQKHLVLRNHTQDPSAIHENAAMWFYGKMGIYAPRTAHAQLYVNGEYAGLYSIVEEVDKKMLARLFGIIEEDTQNDGYLYEYNWVDEWRGSYLGSGLEPYTLRFSAKTHENKSRRGPVPSNSRRSSGCGTRLHRRTSSQPFRIGSI